MLHSQGLFGCTLQTVKTAAEFIAVVLALQIPADMLTGDTYTQIFAIEIMQIPQVAAQ